MAPPRRTGYRSSATTAPSAATATATARAAIVQGTQIGAFCPGPGPPATGDPGPSFGASAQIDVASSVPTLVRSDRIAPIDWYRASGLRRIASQVHEHMTVLAGGLTKAGLDVNGPFFDTVRVNVPGKASAIIESARSRGLLLWQVDADTVQLSLDETTVPADVERVWASFAQVVPGDWPTDYEAVTRSQVIPTWAQRT